MAEHGTEIQPREDGRPERKHVWDDPKNVQILLIVFWTACGVMLLLDLFVDRYLSFKQDEFPMEGWFGFYGFYGFVACVLLVLVAKQMRKVLMRREDYYGSGADE